jgi:hypothetical protein
MLDEDGVTIFDGHTRLAIVPRGEAELGYACQVQIVSGQLSATVEAVARIDANFRQSLKQLHASLKGEAEIMFWSEEHLITIRGDGTGRIEVVANLYEWNPWVARLTAKILLDQSYLPTIIQGIERHFPQQPQR